MVVKTKCKYCGTEYEYTTHSECIGEVEHYEECPNCGYFYNFSYSRPHTNKQYFEELLQLREYKRKKEREVLTSNLFDLIVYSREDGETIAQYSAEHLTGFALKEGKLIICSNQLEKADEYMADEIGFCFRGR